MKTAHKIRINPTPEQTEYLKRACGTRRFIYNWGREQWEKQYQAYQAGTRNVPEASATSRPPPRWRSRSSSMRIRETSVSVDLRGDQMRGRGSF